ncbi:MAG: ankyrin repeat domain-containing protein [Bryobacteraceae bacterium]
MDPEPAPLYQSLGGRQGCIRLVKAFYARVASDPVLRPLFPGTTFKCAIEELAAFLAQFLGGPSADSQKRWWLSLHESHLRFKIGQAERDAWMANMRLAFDDVQLDEPMRSTLLRFFERSSTYVVNQGPATAVEADQAAKAKVAEEADVCRRWDRQRTLDEAVAALRKGDADLAIHLAGSPTLQDCSPTVICGFLAQMVRSGHEALVAYAHEQIARRPELVRERYAGRTLLHEAAAAGSLPTIALLLRLGADPHAPDGGQHTPLYSVGNECTAPSVADAIRVLIQAGARVDACDGVKRCTALHMAARRGNSEAAAALLDAGADIEGRDSLGDTPLRRAVNCGQVEVATLLLSRGANRHSNGSKGTTPYLAAKSAAMKSLMQSGGGTAASRPATG